MARGKKKRAKVHCRGCGGGHFYRKYRVHGPWTQVVTIAEHDGRLDVEETDLDSLTYSPEPKTIQCCECGKRVRNPEADSP